jgi:hypothetical protein
VPIRWRLTIFNALVIGSILLALGFALFFLLRGTLLSSVGETARDRADVAAKEINSGEGLDEDDGRLELDEGLKRGLTLDSVFIVVRDGRGRIIAQTGNPLTTGGHRISSGARRWRQEKRRTASSHSRNKARVTSMQCR